MADPSRRGQEAAPQDEGGKCGKTVIARSSCDEAIQSALAALDCFASLAMTQTVTSSQDEGVLGWPSADRQVCEFNYPP
jgi:hypothetical protein